MQRATSAIAPAESGRRKSIFAEVGLIDDEAVRRHRNPARLLKLKNELREPAYPNNIKSEDGDISKDLLDKDKDETLGTDAGPDLIIDSGPTSRKTFTKLYQLGLLTIVVGLMLPLLQTNAITPALAEGGPVPHATYTRFQAREDSETQVCKRWAGQSTVVNGTIYMYGFRTTTDSQQNQNTWTNDFLTLDLTTSWQISNPSLTALPKPSSGQPAVSLGYLWSSHSALYLYGGQFSDTPIQSPGPNSVWEYNIASKSWDEHKNPTSSAGDNSAGEGQSIQRAAEGAGFSVPNLGRGWYFGGHLDFLTTEGWSNQVARVYLKSLLEFTFPGYANAAVEDLQNGQVSGQNGAYRNITEGGLQGTNSFPARADGALAYVPGFGELGLLLGLTGGDNDTFAQMNVIDVYDIAKSTFYKQSTSGTFPKYRVNPCIVVGSAEDGSSYNVYMYGGQSLQPFGAQTQYDDMWILSVPSFTWIEVDQSNQSVPYARAGHACHVWDGQMIVIGGYVGQQLSCESPGIYAFNMTSLKWSDQFTALTGNNSLQSWNGEQNSAANPLSQHMNQRGFDSKAGLGGSYGYAVPLVVQSVIGGGATGGATLTAPVQTPTEGPFKTGAAQTYTVTSPGVTQTVTPNSGTGNSRQSSGPNVGAIVAGVIAGLFFLIAVYFAFCAWIYRRQVQLWKEHAAAVAAQANEKDDLMLPPGLFSSSSKSSSERVRRDVLAPRSSHSTNGARNASSEGRGVSSHSAEQAPPLPSSAGAGRYDSMDRRSSTTSSTEDLLAGQEPTFWGTRGVLLNPRRSLRVINRD